MLAFISVWIALLTLLLSMAMLLYRPAFTDLSVTIVLWFGSPGALCFAGLVLWAYRKEGGADAGVRAQRAQAKASLVMAILAAAVVYVLIFGSHKLEPFDAGHTGLYNAALGKSACGTDCGTDFPVGRMTL